MSDLVRARLNGVTTTMSRFFADSYGADVLDGEPTTSADGQPLPDVVDVVGDAVATDGYEALLKGDLEAEIGRRNDGLDPGDEGYVTVRGKGNKPDLIAALRTHDAQHPVDPAATAGAENPDTTTDPLSPKE